MQVVASLALRGLEDKEHDVVGLGLSNCCISIHHKGTVVESTPPMEVVN